MSEPVTLIPQTAAHAAEMFALLSDPALYAHEGSPPESPEWLRARFTRLESRRSPDGREQWLNWVVALPSGELAGYVQATVHPGQRADIAYLLGRRHWGRGLASRAVARMIELLASGHGVRTLTATLKRSNTASLRLLERAGFTPAPPELAQLCEPAPDERVMTRTIEEAPRP